MKPRSPSSTASPRPTRDGPRRAFETARRSARRRPPADAAAAGGRLAGAVARADDHHLAIGRGRGRRPSLDPRPLAVPQMVAALLASDDEFPARP